ncbi:MAG: GyrI-like domain-containing protein [Eubacteriales bacterium]|nr:GyrI-like domain-containing protein [Eubacteriales bacterium]
MNCEKVIKPSFAVIGKEGSTEDGVGFIQKLWEDTNAHFSEIADIIKIENDGAPLGIWGAMSDITHSLLPWQENFSKGLYLAGAECDVSVIPPDGWVKWIIPSFEYIRIESNTENAFAKGLEYLKESHLELAGAVHELTLMSTGKEYLYFPIKRL